MCVCGPLAHLSLQRGHQAIVLCQLMVQRGAEGLSSQPERAVTATRVDIVPHAYKEPTKLDEFANKVARGAWDAGTRREHEGISHGAVRDVTAIDALKGEQHVL